jgi:hypothetical protein
VSKGAERKRLCTLAHTRVSAIKIALKQSALTVADFFDDSFDIAFFRVPASLDDGAFLSIIKFAPRLQKFGRMIDQIDYTVCCH